MLDLDFLREFTRLVSHNLWPGFSSTDTGKLSEGAKWVYSIYSQRNGTLWAYEQVCDKSWKAERQKIHPCSRAKKPRNYAFHRSAYMSLHKYLLVQRSALLNLKSDRKPPRNHVKEARLVLEHELYLLIIHWPFSGGDSGCSEPFLLDDNGVGRMSYSHVGTLLILTLAMKYTVEHWFGLQWFEDALRPVCWVVLDCRFLTLYCPQRAKQQHMAHMREFAVLN